MTTPLTILGQTVRHPVELLEVFPAPRDVQMVEFVNDELASMCPVTEQPDLSTVIIRYGPDERCIESKSLKLYLWGFRDRGVFAEAMASEIAQRVNVDARPLWVEVVLRQSVRGGIATTAVARIENDA